MTAVANSCSGCGRPHNAHPKAKINKVKDLATYFDQCLYSIKISDIFWQKHLEQTFFYVFYSLIHLMRCLSLSDSLVTSYLGSWRIVSVGFLCPEYMYHLTPSGINQSPTGSLRRVCLVPIGWRPITPV